MKQLNQQNFFKLLKNLNIISPDISGINDILIAGEKIAAIGKGLSLPINYDCNVFDCNNNIAVPGFIDSHIHIIGGGGEGGFATRTPEIQLSDITIAGITTVIGLLGTDGVTRCLNSLLAKARGLEDEGISAYIYSGAYELPTPTITGNIRKDIILIDKCIGAGEIAMSDHRSSQSSLQAYKEIVAQARVGGMLSGKAGVVNMHMGSGIDGLKMLYEITQSGEIPKHQIITTHINRTAKLLDEGIHWAKKGGLIDITSSINSGNSIKPSKAVQQALKQGVAISQISMSSDGNGSMPIFDDFGNNIGIDIANPSSLLNEFKDMIQKEDISIDNAVKITSYNPANNLKLYPQKGTIKQNSDADILIFDQELNLKDVWARGNHMVQNKKPIIFGTFEKH